MCVLWDHECVGLAACQEEGEERGAPRWFDDAGARQGGGSCLYIEETSGTHTSDGEYETGERRKRGTTGKRTTRGRPDGDGQGAAVGGVAVAPFSPNFVYVVVKGHGARQKTRKRRRRERRAREREREREHTGDSGRFVHVY